MFNIIFTILTLIIILLMLKKKEKFYKYDELIFNIGSNLPNEKNILYETDLNKSELLLNKIENL